MIVFTALCRSRCIQIILLVFLLFGVTGCQTAPAKYIDFSKTQSAPEPAQHQEKADRPLRVAITTVISPNETIQYYRGIADFISRKLDRPVVLIQKRTYEEINILMSSGEIDIAFMSTGAFCAYQGIAPIELLAMERYRNAVAYNAILIVHKDSPLYTFDDLRQRTFAFTDPLSYSGTMVIQQLLREREATPKTFFSNYYYTYSHDKSIWAVANKIVDAASIDDMIYDFSQKVNPKLTESIRVIDTVGPMPTGPVVVNKNMPFEQKQKLQDIFLHMHEDTVLASALHNLLIDQFVLPDASRYAELKKSYTGGVAYE